MYLSRQFWTEIDGPHRMVFTDLVRHFCEMSISVTLTLNQSDKNQFEHKACEPNPELRRSFNATHLIHLLCLTAVTI